MPDPIVAYCGPGAVPMDVWTRWNGDPLLIAALLGLAFMIARGRTADARAGWGAIVLAGVVFLSPLCALASALFSARVLHHVLLIAAVAPLLALAFPVRSRGSLPLAELVVAHVVVLWLWHVPALYAWGLASIPAYWLMQATLLGSAWLMWRAILAPAARPGPALLALGATIVQMGLLGALLAFATRAVYVPHFTTTEPWGLTPIADQQLGGLLMWVPAILPYLAVGLRILWSSLRPAEPVR